MMIYDVIIGWLSVGRDCQGLGIAMLAVLLIYWGCYFVEKN